MKLPSSYAIVMLVCGIVLLYISMAIAGISLFYFKEYNNLIQPLYTFSSVLYFTELALMSYVLWLTNDPIRAFSYLLYTGINILNTLIFTFFASNYKLIQPLSMLSMLSLINIVVQSFFIKNNHIAIPYRIFTLTIAFIVGISMMTPYLAQNLFMSMSEVGRFSSITTLLSCAALMYMVIKIYFLSKNEAKAV